ncbi:Assembly factor cbp4 [Metarhizium acridum]|nr:Assembly factor cbp4 [Metarhizium acridum]
MDHRRHTDLAQRRCSATTRSKPATKQIPSSRLGIIAIAAIKPFIEKNQRPRRQTTLPVKDSTCTDRNAEAPAMPPKQPTNWRLWTKVLVGGVAISVGGPLLTMRLTPTEEELRAKYNPDLLKKSIETREERQQEFDDFVTRLKEYSKSDKPS